MPIPKPRPNEPKRQFVQRCMSDSVMRQEYPKLVQRYAICIASAKKRKKENGN